MRLSTATCLAGLLLLSGCLGLGHYGNSNTSTADRVTLLISWGVLVEKVDSRLVWDAMGANAEERHMTLDPGQHTLSVRYAKGQAMQGRTSVTYDFQPGAVYRIEGVPVDEGKSISFLIAPEKKKEKDKVDTLPVQ